MTPDEARAQQQLVVEAPPNLFVRACPGAGKTRTVVDRFVRVAEEARPRAIAVISFTNRAADEISHRCTTEGFPALAHYPNFIGTFDRFVATYIVRPFGELGGPIRIIDSWDALDVQIAANGVQGTVSLDHFEVSPDGVLRFDPRPGDPLAQGAALDRLEWSANQRYGALRAQGYLTCDDARQYALRLLEAHPKICDLLRERFAEIIVDEAQDCSADELAVLGHLRNGGIPVVVVCDPNQAIYEWRDADPDTLAAFVEDLSTIELQGNWRSAPAVCRLAGTLRDGEADEPVGPFALDDRPILLLPYTGWVSPELGDRFASLVEEAGLDPSQAAILAHQARVAATAAGAHVGNGRSNVVRLAIACSRLIDPRTESAKRQREFDRVQRLLLRLVGVEAQGHSTERAAELAGVSSEWLRRSAIRVSGVVGAIDLDVAVVDWMNATRFVLGEVSADSGLDVVSPGTVFPTPQNSADKTMREVLKAQIGTTGIRHSSVHRAKGTEEAAVLVVLPRDRAPSTRTADLVAAWEANEPSEAKRVVYVAITRAQRLCVLAVPDGLRDQVVGILRGHNAPFDLVT